MVKCVNISPKKRKICIGAMRCKVGLYARDITSPAFSSQENRQTYTLIDTISAAIETKNGIDIFDGVEKSGVDGIPTTATVIFYVRFRTDITAENFLQLDGQNYTILRVEQIDLRREFLKIFTSTRGDLTLEAAK